MSVWSRLFGQSEQKPTTSKPRLGVESLEAREVPAIVFVGGWGSSMYQHADPANPNIVYLGGSTRSDGVAGSPAPSGDFPLDIRRVDAESREVKRDGYLNICDSAALGSISRDQFVFGVELPTAARDFPLDIPPIKGEASDEKNKPQATGDTYSAIAFVGGWGSSAVEAGRGEVVDLLLTSQVQAQRAAEPLPVLMVLADQRDFYETGGGSGRDLLVGDRTVDQAASPALRKGTWILDVTHSRGGHTADDVIVDGRIITAENFDTAGITGRGYLKIKKLNS